MTMISPYSPFNVCRFSVKVNSFVLAINMSIVSHYSRTLIIYFEETLTEI